ncbi:MAG: hypothetical protein QM820_23400 [Minicystis sp.]
MRVYCGWDLTAPEGAVSTREASRKWAVDSPCLRPRADMLPLFCRDGDWLLLDRDGAIWLWSHEIPHPRGPRALRQNLGVAPALR